MTTNTKKTLLFFCLDKKCMCSSLWLLLAVVVVVVVHGQEEESNKLLSQLLEEHRSELSLYTSALEGLGLFTDVLSNENDSNEQYTVFAPSDTAIRNDPHFFLYINGASKQPPTWHLHLRAAVLHHIVKGETALTSDDLFSTTNPIASKPSMQKEVIYINATTQTLGGMGAAAAQLSSNSAHVNLRAKNGILHIVNQVFPVELTLRSLADLENQVEFQSTTTTPNNNVVNNSSTSLVDVVDFVGPRGRAILDTTVTSGLTHVGCSRQALSEMGSLLNYSDDGTTEEYLRQTINDSQNGVRLGELLNATRKHETLQQFIDYSLLPACFYRTDLANDFEQLVLPVEECAHMWVTKRQGRVCFNAACQVDNPSYTGNNGNGNNDENAIASVGHDEPPFREFIARNGYGYVVDQCLLCPGLFHLVHIGATYTSTPIRQSASFFYRVAEREGWNLRHVVHSVLQQAAVEYNFNNGNANNANVKSLTILIPTDKAWDQVNFKGSLSKFDESFRGRLRDDDAWYLHLKLILFHCIIPNIYLKDDLLQMIADKNGSPVTMTSVVGEEIRVRHIAEREKLQMDDEDVFLADVKGIDGYMHFTESTPLPEAMMNSVYTMARKDKKDRFRKQLNFVYHVGLLDFLQKKVPVTGFMVPNDLWPGVGEDDEILREIAANPDVLEQVAPDSSILGAEQTILLNHVFLLGPWSCDDMRNLEGQVVAAANGKNRVIVYDAEKDAPCLAVQMDGGGAPPELLACVVECNILARNGIFHVLDRPIFHVEDPPTSAPSLAQPTDSPQPSSGPPTVSPAPSAPSYAPSMDALPGNAIFSAQPSVTTQPSVTAPPTITVAPTVIMPGSTDSYAPTMTPAPSITWDPATDDASTGSSSAPSTTAEPTSTAEPTTSASRTETGPLSATPTTTAVPSMTPAPSPIASAAPIAAGMEAELELVTMTFYGIRIPIKGIPKLDEEGQAFFQTVTKDWYEMVYDEQASARRARRVSTATQQQYGWRRNLQEAGIYNFTTRVKYTDQAQAVSHPWNTITYTQVVSYLRNKERLPVAGEEKQAMKSTEKEESSLLGPTPRDVLLSPFYDDLLVKNYTDRLRQNELFANITDSGSPLAPRSADQNQLNIGWGSRNYWNVYFILAYIGFGLAVASTFFLTVDLLLKLLLRPLPPIEDGPPPSEAPFKKPSGSRIEFDKRPSDDTALN